MGLRKALKESCNRESCWLRHKCFKEDIDLETRKFTFAPEAPEIWKKIQRMVIKYRYFKCYATI